MTQQEIKDKAYRCDYPYGTGQKVKDASEWGFLQGAKYVQEHMYTEEDLEKAWNDGQYQGHTGTSCKWYIQQLKEKRWNTIK